MRINIFSGGRRIAVIVGALWALGCIAFAVFAEPSASIYYRIVATGNPYLNTGCSADDVTEWTYKKTPKGDSVSVTVCFALADASDGRRMLPYELMEGGDRVRLTERYSTEASAYRRAAAEALVLSPEPARNVAAVRGGRS